jgi:S1-C subfamily serine protease
MRQQWRRHPSVTFLLVLSFGAVGSGCSLEDPPPATGSYGDAVSSGAAGAVLVLAAGCHPGVRGSGFVARLSTVVTAAHVVAGAQLIWVQARGMKKPVSAAVVEFDADQDVAVLHSEHDLGIPLSLVTGDARPGTEGAVVGYPKAHLRYRRATIDRVAQISGRDIYGTSVVSREIAVLSTEIVAGESGGPFVTNTGSVAAIVFGGDPHHPHSFAVPSTTIRKDLRLARTQPVSTERCDTEPSVGWVDAVR